MQLHSVSLLRGEFLLHVYDILIPIGWSIAAEILSTKGRFTVILMIIIIFIFISQSLEKLFLI